MTADTAHLPAPFAESRSISTDVVDIAYLEVGPVNGRAVILLHGWPSDVHAFAEVSPMLDASGFRVAMPYLRG